VPRRQARSHRDRADALIELRTTRAGRRATRVSGWRVPRPLLHSASAVRCAEQELESISYEVGEFADRLPYQDSRSDSPASYRELT